MGQPALRLLVLRYDTINRLEAQNKADHVLVEHAKARQLNMIQVNGNGECLLYALNASHHAHTQQYLIEYNELRLAACVLACEHHTYPEQWIPGEDGTIAQWR